MNFYRYIQYYTNTNPIEHLIEKGDLELIKWRHEHGLHVIQDAHMELAIKTGQLDIVKYYSNYMEEFSKSIEACVRYDQTDCIDHLLKIYKGEDRAQLNTAMKTAGENNNKLMMQKLIAKGGCGYYSIMGAIENGHLELLIWLLTQVPQSYKTGKCKLKMDDYLMHACQFYHHSVFQWFMEREEINDGDKKKAMEQSIIHGYLEAVKHLHGDGVPFGHSYENCTYMDVLEYIEKTDTFKIAMKWLSTKIHKYSV